WFEGALGAHGRATCKRGLEWPEQRLRGHDVFPGIAVDVAQAERFVAHLREHPALIRGVDFPIVVVDERADADAGRATQIDVARVKRREHLSKDQARVVLDEAVTRPV